MDKMDYRTTAKLLIFSLIVVVISGFASALDYNICIEGKPCVWGSTCNRFVECTVEEGVEYTLVVDSDPGIHQWKTDNPRVARIRQPLRLDGSDLVDGTWLKSKWTFGPVDEDTLVVVTFVRDEFESGPYNNAYGYFIVKNTVTPKHGCFIIEGKTCDHVVKGDNFALYYNKNNSEGYDVKAEYDVLSDIWQRGDVFRIITGLKLGSDFVTPKITMSGSSGFFDVSEFNADGDSLTAGGLQITNIFHNESSEVFVNGSLQVGGNITHSSGIITLRDNVLLNSGLEVFGLSTFENVPLLGRTSGFMNVLNRLDIQGDLALTDRGGGYGFGGIILQGVRRSFWPKSELIGVENSIKNPGFENSYDYFMDIGDVSHNIISSENKSGSS
ncbi:hypothetical protein ACFLTH_17900, partial [Bacteroidota bacterium]